jgi:hypothetical protein
VDSLAFMQPETTNSLAAIRILGFDGALNAALARAMANNPDKEEAVRCLKLSRAYLKDARAFAFSPGLHERYLLLASFYRILAHKIYLKVDSGEERIKQGFLRVVK